MLKTVLTLLGLLFSTTLLAELYNYPGGIVDITVRKQSPDLPTVKYGLKDVAVIDQDTSWRILVGVDLATVPGDYLLYIKSQTEDNVAYSQKFQVGQKNLVFFDDSLSDKAVDSIFYEDFSDINFTNSVQPELPLTPPAEGNWADYFGQINVVSLNNPSKNDIEARNYISLTTTELLAITAPQNAIVSRIIKHPISENPQNKTNHTLFLDHGRGLYSILSGVTDITVEAGNGVQAGAVLGKLYLQPNGEPSTLTWQTVLNDTYVNPTILTQIQ